MSHSPVSSSPLKSSARAIIKRRRKVSPDLLRHMSGLLVLAAMTVAWDGGRHALWAQNQPDAQDEARATPRSQETTANPKSDSTDAAKTNGAGLTGWSKALQGLSSRIVTVSAEQDEEDVKLDQPISQFGSFEQLAFAVEIKNTTNQPIKILDTRYGNHFGKSSGKANSNWYGQFLFAIDYFDQSGKQLEFPQVEHVGGSMPVDGALPTSIEAGKTHRFLLRPAKWLSILSPRLKPGSYRAAVRYLGMRESIAEKLKERRPDHEVLGSWSGDVASPRTAFEIKQTSSSPPRNTWGEPINGIRAAIQLVPSKSEYKSGEKPKAMLRLQNVSKLPITISSGLWQSELKMTALDAKQQELKIGHSFYTGWTLVGRVTLKPRQIVDIDAGNIGLATSKARADKFEHVTNRRLISPAGAYDLRFKDRFGGFLLKDGKGKVLAPLDGDWKGPFSSGTLRISLVEADEDAKQDE